MCARAALYHAFRGSGACGQSRLRSLDAVSGFVERDLIFRLIRQLAEVLARALTLARAGKRDEAEQTLEASSGALLGMDFRALALVDAVSVVELLGDARAMVFARLLEGLADVAHANRDVEQSRSRALHALDVALAVASRAPKNVEAQALAESLEVRLRAP